MSKPKITDLPFDPSEPLTEWDLPRPRVRPARRRHGAEGTADVTEAEWRCLNCYGVFLYSGIRPNFCPYCRSRELVLSAEQTQKSPHGDSKA